MNKAQHIITLNSCFWIILYVQNVCCTKIGIIGAGIGGSSAAYFIREIFHGQHAEHDLKIDVFEKSSKAGGRLALVNIDGLEYESGGSIIHPRNLYMKEFVQKFGLKERREFDSGARFGIFDGQNLRFEESKFPILTLFHLFYRYGLDPYRLKNRIDDFVSRFEKIYEIQKNDRKLFASVKDMLQAVDEEFWFRAARRNMSQTLNDWGINEKFSKEMIDAIVKVNYGQNLNVHGLVGSVASAGAQSGLWSIEGGNRLVIEELLEASKAEVYFKYTVTYIDRQDQKGKIALYCSNGDKFTDYDFVVIAAPLNSWTNISLGQNQLSTATPTAYHKLHVYFVRGSLQLKFEHLHAILMCCGYSKINSIGLLKPVNDTRRHFDYIDYQVWKIFANGKIDGLDLSGFFQDGFTTLKNVEWFAYPEYDEKLMNDISNDKFKFLLSNGLYYANSIEVAASAMEMSIIGAKNIALMIGERVFGREMKKTLSERFEL